MAPARFFPHLLVHVRLRALGPLCSLPGERAVGSYYAPLRSVGPSRSIVGHSAAYQTRYMLDI